MIENRCTTDQHSSSRWVTISLLIGVLLVGTGLRLWNLDSRGLWQDEIFTAAIASAGNSLSEVVSIPLYNTALPAPPLYFLITHCFLFLGDNDFVLRFPALAFGVLGLAMTYTLGARLFGKSEGVVGAFLLAIAPFHIRYSQDARFYTLLVLLSLLSGYFLYRGISSGERKWFAGFVVCTLLNVYSHLFAFLVLAAQVVFVVGLWGTGLLATSGGRARYRDEGEVVASSPDRRGVLAFAVSLIIIGLAYTPMAPHLLRGLGGAKGLGGAGRGVADSLSFLVQALDSWSLGSGWRILILLVPSVVGLLAAARGQWKQLWFACCWFLVPFAVLLTVPAGHGFRPRYVLFMLPLFLILVARGLTFVSTSIRQRVPRSNQRARLVGLVVGVGVIALISVPSVRAYYEEDRADWRSVARLIASRLGPEDVIVSPGPFPQVVMPRYEKKLGEAVFLIGGSEVFLAAEDGLRGGVWFVGPAREKMRAIDEELSEAQGFIFKVVFEVDDDRAARGRVLKIAPVMYDDLWVLHVREGLESGEVVGLYHEALELVTPRVASSIRVSLGDFYSDDGQLEQATAEYQEAAILDPRAPEPHRGLALVYEAQGIRDQYEMEWRIYEELSTP
jgi:mannosyltransferase